jgi:periplasmic protein TonB
MGGAGLSAPPSGRLANRCWSLLRPFVMTMTDRRLDRLLTPLASPAGRRRARFFLLLIVGVVAHAILIAIVLREDRLDAAAIVAPTEIPVEVIALPPKEEEKPEAPPPPEPPPAPPPPKPEPPPPPEKPPIDEKPATDAPRAPTKEQIERETPDEATRAPLRKPPTERMVPEPKDEKAPPVESGASAPAVDAQAKTAEDKPDAEIVERADLAPQPAPLQEKAEAPSKAKPAQKPPVKSVAEQIASLEQLDNTLLASPSKPAPVSGGAAKTTYLTILYGMIMPHMHVPPSSRSAGVAGGVVAFYLDEAGHLTHQAVIQSSGSSALDAAAVAAVKRAAPFPAPPRGYPHSILFSYSSR